MAERKQAATEWLQGCLAGRSAVFLHGLPPRLSRGTLQRHFTQLGTVLKILRGSCGRCSLVVFASSAVARRVSGATQRVGGRELTPILVEGDATRQFWRSGDDEYRCDSCVYLPQEEDEDRLFMEGEEKEGVTEVEEAPPERCHPPLTLSQTVWRERSSLRMLRHLRGRSARSLFTKEQLSYDRLQRLRNIDSRALLLGGWREASLRLQRHLKGGQGEDGRLKRRGHANLAVLGHLGGTFARRHL